jgi:tetratricopeptide (TPR) repeat protein
MRLQVLARVLSVCGALVLLSAAARLTVPSLVLVRQAVQLQAAKEYGAAVELYRRLAALRPKSSEPHSAIGEMFTAQGRWSEAEAELLVARQLDPTDAQALYGLGLVAHHRGDDKAAEDLWNEAARIDRFDTDARCSLARLHIAASRFELAERELKRVVVLRREHQEANYLLGLLAAPDSPSLAATYVTIALQGEDSELSGDAQEVLDLLAIGTPISESEWSGRLAMAYLKQGLPTLAVRQLTQFLLAEPTNQTAQAYLGYALASSGEPRRALETLRGVTNEDPKNPLGHFFLGLVHRSQGYLPRALWDFKRSLRVDSSNPAAYAEIADTLRRSGDYGAAEEWYEAACTVAPQEPGFWLLLAQFHVDVMPNAQKGLAAARRAVSLSPADPLAADLLGWARYFGGDLMGAKAALDRAVYLDPELARAHYHRGVVYSELGQLDSAWREYQRAADLDQEGSYRAKAQQELQAMSEET